jgi:hypothetical protein
MMAGKVSDEVMDAIAFIEMHRQETEKESGTGAACAQALPKLQELLDQLNTGIAEPADVHAANVMAVTNDIARVKRFASGGHGGANKHPRQGQKKQAPRQHGQGQGHNQGQAYGQNQGGQNQGGPNPGHTPNQGQGRRRGRNKRRGGQRGTP